MTNLNMKATGTTKVMGTEDYLKVCALIQSLTVEDMQPSIVNEEVVEEVIHTTTVEEIIEEVELPLHCKIYKVEEEIQLPLHCKVY